MTSIRQPVRRSRSISSRASGAATELTALGGVRSRLARWAPPEPTFAIGGRRPSAAGGQGGGSRGQAKVVARRASVGAGRRRAVVPRRFGRHCESGRAIRPERSDAADRLVESDAERCRGRWLRARRARTPRAMAIRSGGARAAAADGDARCAARGHAADGRSSNDAEILRRVRALVEESEQRQQRELALRVAEVISDINAQRQAELKRIDLSLQDVKSKLGVRSSGGNAVAQLFDECQSRAAVGGPS